MGRVIAAAPEAGYLGGFAVAGREILTGLGVEPETLEIRVSDDVNDTTNGIRSVYR